MKNLLIELIATALISSLLVLGCIATIENPYPINQDFKSKEGKWVKDILEKDSFNPETI